MCIDNSSFSIEIDDTEYEHILHLQPIASVHTGKWESAEGLARLRGTLPDGQESILQPARFLEVIREAGRMMEFNQAVILSALRCLELLPDWMRISVNIDPRDLTNELVLLVRDFSEISVDLVARLKFEILEDHPLTEEAEDILCELAMLYGIEFAIDDWYRHHSTDERFIKLNQLLGRGKVTLKVDREHIGDAGTIIREKLVCLRKQLREQLEAGEDDYTINAVFEGAGREHFQTLCELETEFHLRACAQSWDIRRACSVEMFALELIA